MAADSEFTALTRRLCCLRGISTLTGFALAVELGDWDRFTGSSIGAYLGLVPSEHSSGESRRQGGITKTGNPHARRLLIEAAWHHQPRYTVGKVLQARWDQANPAARARGHAGNHRFHRQWAKYTATPQEAHRRQHRHRPRAGRLVLVPGHSRPALDARSRPNPPTWPGHADRAQREEPTRVSTVSHQLRS